MIKVWYNLCTPRCGFIKSFGKGDECEIVETESGEGEWEWRGCLRVETEWEWLGEWERRESGEVLHESERLREAWESTLGESERVSESGETLFLKKPYTKSSLRDLVSRWESTRISHSLVLCFTCPFQIDSDRWLACNVNTDSSTRPGCTWSICPAFATAILHKSDKQLACNRHYLKQKQKKKI